MINAVGSARRIFVSVAVLLSAPALAAWAQEEVADTQRELVIDDSPIVEAAITDADRDHWAFKPVVRPPVPAFTQAPARTPLDALILARLAKQNLDLAPPAERSTLLRRVTFDLTGLPPTLGERASFLANGSPDAYEQTIDRLLASPAHGEHVGQAWLDLARFAETDGYEHDKVRSGAWQYRDWVIRQFNQDLPYDQFLQMQLAGDELHPGDEQARIATGFCLSGPDMPDINDQEERRHVLLNELTATVSSVIIGLQLGCAQCHDHKYDPLSQADFFRLRACFEPAVQLKKDKSVDWLRESSPPAVARLWIRGDHRRPGGALQPDVPRIAKLHDEQFVSLLTSAARARAAGTPAADPASKPQASFRRTAAARWFTQADHPLTGRVMVNRLWQQHFGRGLSSTPSDFGLLGESPTHPELLDYLAAELVARDWSLKTIRRQIVQSAVYRQASWNEADSPAWSTRLERDPTNQWLSRYPRRRLDGEAIRDSMLAAAGLLDRQGGGPGVMPPLPPELTSTLLKNQWQASKREADHYRRSVYIFARRNLRYPLFEAFDRPDANASCPARIRSTTAPQALLMLNSAQVLQFARHVAAQVYPRNPVPGLVRQTLQRDATEQEIRALHEFIEAQTQAIEVQRRDAQALALPVNWPADQSPARGAAIVQAALALLNSNEMIYLD
jgi:hypothetical protein